MSTATVSRKAAAARKSAIDAAAADIKAAAAAADAAAAAGPESSPVPAAADAAAAAAAAPSPMVPAAADAPTLGDVLRAGLPATLPVPAAADAAAAPSTHASRVLAFTALQTELGEMIVRQTRAFIGFFADRGDVVRRAVNVKLAGSTTSPERATNRAAALKGMDSVAQANFDASTEPTPNMQRWVYCAVVREMFGPDVVRLKSVSVVETIAKKTIDREINPRAWSDPDTYVLSPRFNRSAMVAMVRDAADNGWTESKVLAEIERIGGLLAAAAPKTTVSDPNADAVKAADAIWERIAERDNVNKNGIDGFAFFNRFAEIAKSRGFAIVPGNDGAGVPIVKMLKIG